MRSGGCETTRKTHQKPGADVWVRVPALMRAAALFAAASCAALLAACSPCAGVVCPTGQSCDATTGFCTGAPTATTGGCGADSDCTTAGLPRCEPTSKSCVQCVAGADCATGSCDGAAFVCVPKSCTADGDCATVPHAAHCDVLAAICVGCTSDAQCAGDGTGPRRICAPAEQACVVFPCTGDVECEGDPGGPRCDAKTGHCIECSADVDCTGAAKRCGPTHRCVACLADADCDVADGYACHADTNACYFAGCVRDDQCAGGTRCAKGTRACVRCLVDADCAPTGGACVAGACASRASCGGDADCAFPARCDGGVCAACDAARACRGNEVCTSGACAEPVACADSGSCLAGRTCQASLCAPAACADDAYAPNQSAGAAAGLSLATPAGQTGVATANVTGLVLCPNADDWFTVAANDGDGVQVEVHFATASEPVQLALFRAAPGGGLAAVGFTEVAPYGLRATAGALPAGSGPVYVQVRAPGDSVNYQLAARTQAGGLCADDFRDPNATPMTSSPLAPGVAPLVSCPGADDWFKLDVQAPTRVEVTLAEPDAAHDLLLELHDGTSSTSGGVVVGSDPAKLDYATTGAQRLYLLVKNVAGTRRPYSLQLQYRPPPPANDVCAGAAPLAPGTLTPGTTVGANADGAAPCATAGGPDVFYAFDLAAASGVTLDLSSAFDGALAVFASCGGAPLACTSVAGGAEELKLESLPAGHYLVGVASSKPTAEGTFTLSETLTTPPPPPANATCATAAPLSFAAPASGNALLEAKASGDVASAPDSLPAECAPAGSPGGDAVYTFTLAQPRGVLASLAARYPAYLTLRSGADCAQGVACAAGPTAAIGKLSLAAGSYSVVVDGGGPLGGPYALDVQLFPPAANETCATAAPLANGASASGDTRLAAHDYALTCADPRETAPDVAFQFTLTQPQGAHLALDATYDAALALRATSCVDASAPANELGCSARAPVALDFPLLQPGTYYAVVSGYRDAGGPFTLHLALRPPAQPPPNADCAPTGGAACDAAAPLTFDASGNASVDGTTVLSCDGLHPPTCTGVPARSGSTQPALSGPDVTYAVPLKPGQTLAATLTPSGFDGALYLLPSCAASACLAGSDKSFLPGGVESITYTLPPSSSAATLLLVVDSFAKGASGPFHLDAHVSGP